MTTYYTYATKAYDYHGKAVLETAWVNITDEMVFMSNLKGKFTGLVEGAHYQIVKQPKKIASRGNKAQRWVSQVCKQTGLRRLHKDLELKYAQNLGGIRIK
jgi:hypothetical protein